MLEVARVIFKNLSLLVILVSLPINAKSAIVLESGQVSYGEALSLNITFDDTEYEDGQYNFEVLGPFTQGGVESIVTSGYASLSGSATINFNVLIENYIPTIISVYGDDPGGPEEFGEDVYIYSDRVVYCDWDKERFTACNSFDHTNTTLNYNTVVPLPASAVFFGSALLGLFTIKRKN